MHAVIIAELSSIHAGASVRRGFPTRDNVCAEFIKPAIELNARFHRLLSRNFFGFSFVGVLVVFLKFLRRFISLNSILRVHEVLTDAYRRHAVLCRRHD